MKKLIILGFVLCAGAASAAIRVPYFKPLSEKAVCGGVPRHCEPTSSRNYQRFGNRPLEYAGDPVGLIGRRLRRNRNPEPCVTSAITEDNLIRRGGTTVRAEARNQTVSQLHAQVKADLRRLLERITSTLPEGLIANVSAELNNAVTVNSVRHLDLTYERVDLRQEFIDTQLAACQSTLQRNERVVTGVALMTVSGDWARDRLQSVLARLEATATFQRDVTADALARYEANKRLVLNSRLQPTTFIIAAAWR